MSQPDAHQVREMFYKWTAERYREGHRMTDAVWNVAMEAFTAGAKAGAAFATGYMEAKHESEVRRGR